LIATAPGGAPSSGALLFFVTRACTRAGKPGRGGVLDLPAKQAERRVVASKQVTANVDRSLWPENYRDFPEGVLEAHSLEGPRGEPNGQADSRIVAAGAKG
jgi:hypothetical protein